MRQRNWPISQIPQCTWPISHNAPFRTEMCTFLFWKVHCGIWNSCIVGFANKVNSPSVWTPFHPMYENSTLCTNWFVHQANTTGAFIVHQANAAGAFIVHQGNVVEHFGSYIKHCGWIPFPFYVRLHDVSLMYDKCSSGISLMYDKCSSGICLMYEPIRT